MAKVITLGEIMLRLSTPRNEKLIQAKSLDMCFGGGEANVAVSLANFGYESEFVTKLVDNPLGDCVIAELKKMNVITKNIVRGGDRLGLYFLETGGMIRPSNVVYDRANSSIADANVDEFDFYKIFDGGDWFHFSGITPAISDKASLIVKKACQVAKEKKIKIYFLMVFTYLKGMNS